MTKAIIRDNYLNYNGIRYFRANSEEIELGSYGPKRTPLFGANYLEVHKNLPFSKLKIDRAAVIDIDQTASRESDFSIGAGFKVLGMGANVSANRVYDLVESNELSLVKLSVDIADMVSAINNSSRARDRIDDLGNSARIAHQIFVIMEANMARQVSSAGSFDVSAERGDLNLEFSVSGGSSRTTDITIAEGSTFAYLLLDLKWDHSSKRKRTKVVSAKDDQWSFG